jgi:hypothetical protein
VPPIPFFESKHWIYVAAIALRDFRLNALRARFELAEIDRTAAATAAAVDRRFETPRFISADALACVRRLQRNQRSRKRAEQDQCGPKTCHGIISFLQQNTEVMPLFPPCL